MLPSRWFEDDRCAFRSDPAMLESRMPLQMVLESGSGPSTNKPLSAHEYTSQREHEYTNSDDRVEVGGGMLGGCRDGGMAISCETGFGVEWVMSALHPNYDSPE
jgi:hypothetical protein